MAGGKGWDGGLMSRCEQSGERLLTEYVTSVKT